MRYHRYLTTLSCLCDRQPKLASHHEFLIILHVRQVRRSVGVP